MLDGVILFITINQLEMDGKIMRSHRMTMVSACAGLGAFSNDFRGIN